MHRPYIQPNRMYSVIQTRCCTSVSIRQTGVLREARLCLSLLHQPTTSFATIHWILHSRRFSVCQREKQLECHFTPISPTVHIHTHRRLQHQCMTLRKLHATPYFVICCTLQQKIHFARRLGYWPTLGKRDLALCTAARVHANGITAKSPGKMWHSTSKMTFLDSDCGYDSGTATKPLLR